MMSEQRVPAEITALVTCVTPIKMMKGNASFGQASGFFFVNHEQLFLITNRHVVIDKTRQFYPDSLVIRVHADRRDLRNNVDLPLPLYIASKPVWREFDDETVDIVAIPLNNEWMQRYVILPMPPASLPPDNIEIELGRDLLVIGYPLGFYDDVFNLPIARNASLASVYPVPFGGKPYFVIDARLHPGTSGSPVITKPTSVVPVKSGVSFSAKPVLFLLGVHSHTWPVPKGEEPLGLNAVWFSSLIVELTKKGG